MVLRVRFELTMGTVLQTVCFNHLHAFGYGRPCRNRTYQVGFGDQLASLGTLVPVWWSTFIDAAPNYLLHLCQ